MAKEFFRRLRGYYASVALVLRGEASAASIFPNTTDVGMSRENVYVEFLRQHAPSRCNVFLGGFVFGEDGAESKQLDIIVTTDTTPRFDFHNSDGRGKSFSPVEGTLGIVSIKSTLNKSELEDALSGIASVPPTMPLGKRVNSLLNILDYDDWPYKIVYSSDGIAGDTLLFHLNKYYIDNPGIPTSRRPNLVHVAGKYILVRVVRGMSLVDPATKKSSDPEVGSFVPITTNSDISGILWTLDALQLRATASAHILYSYANLINSVGGLVD